MDRTVGCTDFTVLGPKVGKYAANMFGIEGTTKDMWSYRTVNRSLGWLPKTDENGENLVDRAGNLVINGAGLGRGSELESEVADEANARAASALGMAPSEVQELLWASEQDFYIRRGVWIGLATLRQGVESYAKSKGLTLDPMSAPIAASWNVRLGGRRDAALVASMCRDSAS